MKKVGHGFQLLASGELAYLQAPLLAGSGEALHGFSTRRGGVSSGPNSTLNMAYHTGDEADCVAENRRRFLERFNLQWRDTVSGIQVHGTDIAVVQSGNRGEGALPRSAKLRCDALLTVEPNVTLTAYAADCQLLFFLARDRSLAAIAHAGRQGALEGMASKVIAFINEKYGISAGDLLVAMAPAICGRCYRVDEKAAAQFRAAGWDQGPYLEATGTGDYYLDLGQINKAQILGAGVGLENLAVNRWCTSCEADLFFSYRRDKGSTGRMIGFITLTA